MSETQRRRYRITGYNFTEISRGKGSIEYQLMDDFGNERTVTAMAKLNLFKKISQVKPIYQRESPLVQALAHKQLNDSVIVDFTEFNKKHSRGSVRSTKVSVPSSKLRIAGTAEIHDFSSIFDNKTRLFQIILFSIIGFVCFSFVLTKFT